MKNIISINDLKKDEIEKIFEITTQLKKNPKPNLMKGKLMANCFFEPSTRTRLSFEAAMLKLGGQVTSFVDPKSGSMTKGESLNDTIKVISQYVDLIVLRHPLEGAARFASEISSVPIINAGDGSNQHPTQTLLDLYSIYETQNKLSGLHVAFFGDLKYGRTIHSFASIAHHYNFRLYLVSPEGLEMPQDIIKQLRHNGVKFSIHKNIEEVLPKLDILYVTRIQKERIKKELLDDLNQTELTINKAMLQDVKKNLKILHPLPRVNEINTDIDDTKFAYYFEQAKNGLYVRQALLNYVLGNLK